MLKLILSAIVSLGLGSFAFAQEPPAGGSAPAGNEAGTPPAGKMDKKMDKKMGKKHKKEAKDTKTN